MVARLQKQYGLPKSRTRRKGLPRGATEYPRDSNVVGDILQARQLFRKVVVELNLYSLDKFYNNASSPEPPEGSLGSGDPLRGDESKTSTILGS